MTSNSIVRLISIYHCNMMIIIISRASMVVNLEKTGEVNIENGLFEEYERTINVNNKDLLIKMR